MKRADYVAYTVLVLFSLWVLLIVFTGYRTSLLLFWLASLAALLLLTFSLTGIVGKQPITNRSKIWRIIGATPLILGAAFLLLWILALLAFALFHSGIQF